MKQPLFSIVVPIYNVEAYLNRCVESLVNQTYTSLEIILVDDGSPDCCGEICDEWAKKDRRIRVVHKQNAGLGMARNTGLDIVKGDFIFFVDSDDYLIPDAVERCAAALAEYDSDTLLFGRYDAYPDGTVVEDRKSVVKRHYLGKEVLDELLPELLACNGGYGISACSKVFSNKIFSEHKMRFKSEREIISEDTYFCIDYFSKAENVLVIPDRFYCYYKNENSLSRTYRDDRQKKNDDFLVQSLERMRELSLGDKLEAYLKSKYHIFSLAAMKHIMISDLSQKDKKNKLRKIYNSSMLRETISADVLRTEPLSIVTLMLLIKLKIYSACDLLLKIKTRK